MKDSQKARCRTGLAAGLIAALALTGCAGPSTRVLPREQYHDNVREVSEETPVLEEVNPFYLQESLDMLTVSARPGGSRGESGAAQYMMQLLEDYGYTVSRQRFRRTGVETVTGTNVIAVKEAPAADADILLVTTHHDSADGSPGANDNASGIAVLLEMARLLSVLPTDTELRFVSFSEHGADQLGSSRYMESLTKQEKERMLGAINLDMLGHVDQEQIMLGTPDGRSTMLGDMLQEAAWEVLEETWSSKDRTLGTASVLMRGQIPVVTVGQAERGFENGTPFDTAAVVDIERVSQVVDVICRTVSRIMSEDTPSLSAKAHFQNNLREYAFIQEKDTPMVFGSSVEEVQNQLAMNGQLAAVNSDSSGKRIDKYQFRMKWFGVDQVIPTNYYFLEGRLNTVSLDAAEVGVDFDEMEERLSGVYGKPAGMNSGPNGTEYDWTDPVNRRFIALIPEGDGYDLEIREYSMERRLLEQRRPDGTRVETYAEDRRAEQLMRLVQQLFFQPVLDRVAMVTFYTDGAGAETGYVQSWEAPDQETEPGAGPLLWEIGIDVEDAMTADGRFRNRTELVKQLVGICGQLLEESEPEGCYGAFLEQFPEDEGNGEPAVRPGIAPGVSNQNEIDPPDFRTAFTMFVLTGKPAAETGNWNRRVRFFYEYEELVTYRNQVWNCLKMQE